MYQRDKERVVHASNPHNYEMIKLRREFDLQLSTLNDRVAKLEARLNEVERGKNPN